MQLDKLIAEVRALKAAQPITWKSTLAHVLGQQGDVELTTFARDLGAGTAQGEAPGWNPQELDRFVDSVVSKRSY